MYGECVWRTRTRRADTQRVKAANRGCAVWEPVLTGGGQTRRCKEIHSPSQVDTTVSSAWDVATKCDTQQRLSLGVDGPVLLNVLSKRDNVERVLPAPSAAFRGTPRAALLLCRTL